MQPFYGGFRMATHLISAAVPPDQNSLHFSHKPSDPSRLPALPHLCYRPTTGAPCGTQATKANGWQQSAGGE